MDWGITGIGDRTIGTRIGDGLYNTGGMAVINYMTQNGGFTGEWRACRYYGVTDGVERRYIIKMNVEWAGGPYTTLGMAVINYITHNGDFTGVWRACRYYGVTDGVDWYKDCGWASQHWAGGGCVSGGYSTLIMQWNGVTDGVVRRCIIKMNVGWAGGPYTTLKVLWNEWTTGDWRWALQHWVGSGWVVGEYSTLIMQWNGGDQLYDSEWGLHVRVEGMPLLRSGPYTTLKVLWNEWTTGVQKLMGEGLGDNGGMAVINYITHNGDFTGVWRACRYYGVTDGVDWYKDCGWASQHWAGGGCVSGGGMAVINYITHNGDFTGVWRACRYYVITDGVVRRYIIRMNVGWAGGPYTTLKALWNEPKDWYKDWGWASQHWNGGLTGVWRACRYYGVTNGVVRRNVNEDECWKGGAAEYHSECIVGEVVERQWGGRSSLIMRRKCCEQEYNIELVMEGCGMSEPLLLRGGWSRRKNGGLTGVWRACRYYGVTHGVYCGMRGQRLYRNCLVMDWGITLMDDRTVGTRIGGGLHNSRGNVVMNWMGGPAVMDREKSSMDCRVIGVRIGGGVHKSRTPNCYWSGVGRAYHSYCLMDGAVRKGLSLLSDGLGAEGNGRPNDWRRHWICSSQLWVGDGGVGGVESTVIGRKYGGGSTVSRYTTLIWCWRGAERACRYYGVMEAVAKTYFIENDCLISRPGDTTINEYGEQLCNTELLLEGFGSVVPLLMRGGWSSSQRPQCQWMLDMQVGHSGYITNDGSRTGRRMNRWPNDWYKDCRWVSQLWVRGGGIDGGVFTLIRQWKYEFGWEGRPYDTLKVLWDMWTAVIGVTTGGAVHKPQGVQEDCQPGFHSD
ncbi:hypothetical protein T01_6668 [Trichinella spiralis]|uniref:Uncharacterized protein n=1 Tax=Trichinella spiralis TaxID=6334 RepID=A0A0V1BGI9_TRISP|nr:hypothetical protein T01_6668 [Trichinella spiralis]